tara:strand:- start:200 stop:388 length:189 start_codon:yes stop_codon:yes gene_type:complete
MVRFFQWYCPNCIPTQSKLKRANFLFVSKSLMLETRLNISAFSEWILFFELLKLAKNSIRNF